MRLFRHSPCALLSLAALHALFATVVPSNVRAQEKQIDYAALRDETVRAMSEYLQINTTNPPGNELATAKWLQAFLAKEGIEGKILDTAELGKGRANFYARLKGDGSQKAIALVHHMDVVPANAELWSVPPFSGAVKDGYVWGRGALDMKSEGSSISCRWSRSSAQACISRATSCSSRTRMRKWRDRERSPSRACIPTC